jgi:hypothetical protein
MPSNDVWLAPPTGSVARPAADQQQQLDPFKMAWLPNSAIAELWMQYVSDTKVLDTTPPPNPTQIQVKDDVVTWQAEADLESGLAHFIIQRDGKFLARLPEIDKGRFGRPVFQGMQYSDTPTRPLIPMRFVDKTADPCKKHVYRVTAVNTAGIQSSQN